MAGFKITFFSGLSKKVSPKELKVRIKVILILPKPRDEQCIQYKLTQILKSQSNSLGTIDQNKK